LRDRFNFGHKLYSLWKEYEESKTPEARFVKVLDKIESHLHIIERGGTGSGVVDAKHQALYADEAVRNFPELKPLLKSVKKRLKPLLEKQGMIWKEEYNYPD
jgi:5'-deoxynucleotidase YfbR-like HD superfamily hydrolase